MTDHVFEFDQPVVLAGQYDPASIAPLIGGDGGKALSTMSGPPGVPIHDLAREFTRRRIQTTLLGGILGTKDLNVQSSPLSAIIYPKRGRIAWIADGLKRERKIILAHLQEIQPAIVHSHWTLESSRAVADWDGPKVLTVHDAAWECARIGSEWHWGPLAHASTLRWLANTSAVLHRFKHIIAVSPYVEYYLRLKHQYRGEIRVIPNAVPPLPDLVQIPDPYPKSGCITFACYGYPGPLKNVDTAIRGFLILKRDLPNCRLLVYGGNWEQRSIEYSDAGIEFRGAKPHSVFLSELATEVDIWVHPSRIESQGLAMCEAIQAGCPVIAGHASGAVPWTLDYGRAGQLVNIESPADIAQAMLALAKQKDRRLVLVRYGRQMIADRFGLDRFVRSHMDFYRDIIAADRHRRH